MHIQTGNTMPITLWFNSAGHGLGQDDAKICSDNWRLGVGAYSDG